MKKTKIGRNFYEQITEEEFCDAQENLHNSEEIISFCNNYFTFADGYDAEPICYFKKINKKVKQKKKQKQKKCLGCYRTVAINNKTGFCYNCRRKR